MTKKSGVKGKTVRALARSTAAAERKFAREQRDSVAQIALLDTRPGRSTRERLRQILAADPGIAQRGAERRRARRRAGA
jgi:hypothetical protein